jgi:integrase/recombinase XerC
VRDVIGGFRRDQQRRGLLGSTIEKRCRSVALFDRQAGALTATAEDIEAWLDGRDLSARTRYWWLSTLHAFYGYCTRAGLRADDPTVTIVRPRLRRSLPRPMSSDDLAVAIAMAEPQMRAFLVLASFAGLRCMEIAHLEREHVLETWEPTMLRIVGKGERERMVPMHSLVWAALRTVGMPSRGRVFRNRHGQPMSASAVSQRINQYLHDIGITATAHQMRHWFGTRTYQATRDLRAVQELLGHSTPTVTAAYAAFDPIQAELAVNALELPRR